MGPREVVLVSEVASPIAEVGDQTPPFIAPRAPAQGPSPQP